MMQSKWVVAIGLALGAVFGYDKLYRPQQKKVAQIRAQVAQEKATQQTQAGVASVLEQIEKQYRPRLSADTDPSGLAREVVSLAQKAGLQLATISQAAPERIKEVTRLAVDLRVKGTYHQLGTFLDSLERSQHLLRVDHLDVSAAYENSRDPATIQLRVSTLYLLSLNVTSRR